MIAFVFSCSLYVSSVFIARSSTGLLKTAQFFDPSQCKDRSMQDGSYNGVQKSFFFSLITDTQCL